MGHLQRLSAMGRRLAFLGLVVSLCGCARLTVPTRNIAMFDEDGRLLDPTGTIGCNDSPRLCQGRHLTLLPYRRLDRQQRDPYLQELLSGLRQTPPGPDGRRRLFIFVHGGLNTQKGSVERAVKLTPQLSAAGYYPLFINWRSSLVSSYFDHAFFIRQGETWRIFGPLTAPVVLATDLGRSIVRAPLVWGAQFQGAFASLPETDLPYDLARRESELVRAAHDNPEGAIHVTTGEDARTGGDLFLSGLSWFLLEPVRLLVSAPLIDGLGTSAWDNMLRRTRLLYHTNGEYTGGHPDGAQGDLALVLRQLEQELAATSDQWEIVLVGHSMGTIVLNELLREFPRLPVDTIVYMAAACTVHDFEQSIVPFLTRHPRTHFYNLTLHHKAEERERFDILLPYFDPVIRGSLLTWIDDFFANPLTPRDKTLGQYVNFLRTEQLFPAELRGRIHQREFGVGGGYAERDPQVHGSFGEKRFWEAGFYTEQVPVAAGSQP